MSEKKNICLTINSLAGGGAEKQCLLLAKALNPYHHVTVVILNPHPVYAPWLEMVEKADLNHVFLPKNPIKKIFAFIRFLKRNSIHIIFAFLPTDTVVSAICGRLAQTPYIFGGIRNSYLSTVKYTSLKIVHNYLLSYTISNNYAAHQSAIEYGFKKRILVIPNGIEIKPLKQRKLTDFKKVTIISVGRLVRQKDYQTAIRSVAKLKKILGSNISLCYKIVGRGPEQSNILRDIERYDIVNEVELITDSSNIYGLLESSDIYLCTSTFEGISNSILEAMNCALPIVATNAGDNSRLVLHGENGFIADIYDDVSISEHLHDLIKSPTICNQMGIESYNHLVRNYSYATFQKKYLHIISHIESQIQDVELQIKLGFKV